MISPKVLFLKKMGGALLAPGPNGGEAPPRDPPCAAPGLSKDVMYNLHHLLNHCMCVPTLWLPCFILYKSIAKSFLSNCFLIPFILYTIIVYLFFPTH